MTQLPNDPMTSDSRAWYVIQTRPGNEHRVEMNLLNQEIEVFLPLVESYQYLFNQRARRIKPLFPNYLFARLDLHLHYCKVKYTRGVSKILGSGVEPMPISEEVIQMIKNRMGRDNLVRLEDEWKEGDLVRINSGPFKDLRGIFQKKMSDSGRVRILLNLIGVDVSVQISSWQIRKVA